MRMGKKSKWGMVYNLLVSYDLIAMKLLDRIFGSNLGNSILKKVADCIKPELRGTDILVRFGGEEFLAFLMDTTGDGGVIAAEKVRAAVEARKIPIPSGTIQKTISIGVADFPSDSGDFWEAVKFADTALYTAKERGRNRVVRFTPDLWQGNSK